MHFCFSSSSNTNLLAQIPRLSWGVFSSHPARFQIEQCPQLNQTDARLLSLFFQKTPFDPARFSRVPSFSNFFTQYNKSHDEFERSRLVEGIRTKFERRQKELSEVNYFVTTISGSLGAYSFEQKGFPFTVESSNNEIQLPYTISSTLSSGAQAVDQTVFPTLIHFPESKAEQLIKKNPSRNFRLYLVVKAVGPITDAFMLFNNIPLYGNAVYCVVTMPKTNEVIAVFPSEDIYNYEIERLLNNYQELVTKNSIASKEDRRVQDISEYGNQTVQLATTLREKINSYKQELSKQQWKILKSVDSLELQIAARIDTQKQLLEALVSSPRIYSGQLVEGIWIWNPDAVNLKFQTYNPNTSEFVGEIQRGKDICRINGKIIIDALGPKLLFDETEFVRKDRRSLHKGYSLQLKSETLLLGTFNGGKIRLEIN